MQQEKQIRVRIFCCAFENHIRGILHWQIIKHKIIKSRFYLAILQQPRNGALT